MLQELERKGYIQRQLGSSRNVQVTRFPGLEQNTYSDTNSASINMPPKAGKDGDESNLVRHQADLLVAMLGNTDHFKMTVTDNAMVGAGILPGDVAIVHRCCNVSNGCVAAVFYKGDLLLRRLVKTSSRVLLKVANEHSVEHLISIDEVQIRGELITLLRNCLPGGLALAR